MRAAPERRALVEEAAARNAVQAKLNMWHKFRLHGFLLILVSLGQYWQLCITSALVLCSLDFNVEHNNGDSSIAISVQWNSDLCKQDELPALPHLARTGVQPLVWVSNCRKRYTTVHNSTLSIGHTLMAVAQLNTSTVTNEGGDHNVSRWTLRIPEYLLNESCIEVLVKGTAIAGPAMQLADVRRQLWIGDATQSNTSHTICSDCEVIDFGTHNFASVSLVKDGTSVFLLHFSSTGQDNATSVIDLPECIQTNESMSWTRFDVSEGCREDIIIFTPTRVHLSSESDVYITGNGILYSPNRGVSWYQLLAQPISFAVSSDGKYAFTLIYNESNEAWVGFIGSPDILQVYPSTILDRLWDTDWWSGNVDFSNATVEFDDQNNLHIETDGNISQKLPLSLLLQNTVYKAQVTSQCNSTHSSSLQQHPLSATERMFHHLTDICRDVCPYTDVTVRAPICGSVTRSKFHLVQEGFLQWKNKSNMPEMNCDVMGDTIPRDIFLSQSQNYTFNVEFFLSPGLSDPSNFFLVNKMSDPAEVLDIELRPLFHSQNNSMAYEILLQEQKHFSGQYEPGYTLTSVDVDFQVPGANALCQDTFSTQATTSDHLQTRVHIGCPPGLSLHFDAQSTTSRNNQHCTPRDNISCYFFANEFHPVFRIIDSVTEEQNIYNGVYTLRALRGGTKATNMRSLTDIENVESTIWTPVNESKSESPPQYRYTDSAIKWVCGTTSPCGDIFPLGGRTPEYYFLLEASNRVVAENDTYCELSVQFQIKIHGMGMGAITTVGSFLFFHAVVILTVICMFGTWHYRLKFLYWKDIASERWTEYTDQHDNVLTNLIRKHRDKNIDTDDPHTS